MTQEPSYGNENPKKIVQPEYFYARFNEEWKVVKGYDKTKGMR